MANQATLQKKLKLAQAKYARLANALTRLGPIRKGSIYQTTLRCGSCGCRCQRDPEARHGPYWLWTAKVDGKSKCRQLNPEALKIYRQQSKNYAKLKQIITKMEPITEEITEYQIQLAALDAR